MKALCQDTWGMVCYTPRDKNPQSTKQPWCGTHPVQQLGVQLPGELQLCPGCHLAPTLCLPQGHRLRGCKNLGIPYFRECNSQGSTRPWARQERVGTPSRNILKGLYRIDLGWPNWLPLKLFHFKHLIILPLSYPSSKSLANWRYGRKTSLENNLLKSKPAAGLSGFHR